MVNGKSGRHRKTITNGYALHHTHDAEMGNIKRTTVHGHVKPVNQQANNKQQQRALDGLVRLPGRPMETSLTQTEKGGDTHDEQEEGENKIARRHPIPLGMLQGREDLIAGTIVDKYHEHDRQATQHIQTHKSFHHHFLII